MPKSEAASSKPIVLRFQFDDFENHPSNLDDALKSKDVTDNNGNTWALELYPGGRDDGSGDADDDEADDGAERNIDLVLVLSEGSKLYATCGCIVRGASGSVYYYSCGWGGSIDVRERRRISMGVKRSEIIAKKDNILVDGALMVDLEIRPRKKQFSPKEHSPVVDNLLKLLESGDDADVTFKVGETSVPAHKLALKMNAPLLHSFCNEHEDDSPVPIEGTSLEVFRLLLRCVYAGSCTSNIWKILVTKSRRRNFSKEVIDAANRYGIVQLKLLVESILVERRVVNLRTVVDWLLFADAKTCPLLKEEAMSYASVMAKDVLQHETFDKLKESPRLLSELMLAMSDNSDDRFHQTSNLTVGELRGKLKKGGLDVDGSKEMLVSRLEESNKRQRSE